MHNEDEAYRHSFTVTNTSMITKKKRRFMKKSGNRAVNMFSVFNKSIQFVLKKHTSIPDCCSKKYIVF